MIIASFSANKNYFGIFLREARIVKTDKIITIPELKKKFVLSIYEE